MIMVLLLLYFKSPFLLEIHSEIFTNENQIKPKSINDTKGKVFHQHTSWGHCRLE